LNKKSAKRAMSVRNRTRRAVRGVLNRLLVWSVCVMVLLSIAVFVGAFAGAAAAWFARGVIADVQRDDEEVDRGVRAEQVRDWAARKANAA
jgi:uncharacterized membrane protein